MSVYVCRSEEDIFVVQKSTGILEFHQKPDRFVRSPDFQFEARSKRQKLLDTEFFKPEGIGKPLVTRSLLKGQLQPCRSFGFLIGL